MYLEEKLNKECEGKTVSNEQKKALIERIKKDFNEMKEKRKIRWIRKALADEVRYLQELEEFKETHAEFIPSGASKPKSVLNKKEKAIKDHFDGKPHPPPNSGYSFFSKLMLSKLPKEIGPKERMVQIGKRWKELSPEEREKYNMDAQLENVKYTEDFLDYVKKLPEEVSYT